MVDDRSRPESPTLQSVEDDARQGVGGARQGVGDAARQGVEGARPDVDGPARLDRCLSEDDVLAYAGGATTDTWRERLHRHLDACEACRLLLQHTIAAESLATGELPPASLSEVLAGKALMTFAPGQRVAGRYLIESFIGKGGMGEVYRALDQLLGKHVALKTVLCTAGDDPRAVRKLIDEVRHAEAVTHPNVCRIQALFEHRDAGSLRPPVPFFTMEFIEGETLAARCRRGLLELDELRSIARQLLEGLKAAHAKGVRHLDFKSDNVMLRAGSPIEAVVMDFGLSRDQKTRSRTSEHHGWMGTLPYMALEQLEGRPQLGTSVDVYAFGVVLYEMLTGQLPFRGPSPGAMILQQLRERPLAPSQLRQQLAPEVDAFVQRCLRSSPDDRFVDAAAALEAFDRISHWERRGLELPRRVRQALVIGGLAFALGALAAFDASRSETRSTEARIDRLQTRPASGAPAQERSPQVAEARREPAASSDPAAAAPTEPQAPAGASDAPSGSPASLAGPPPAEPATTETPGTATPTTVTAPDAPSRGSAKGGAAPTPAGSGAARSPGVADAPRAVASSPPARDLKHVPRRPLPLDATPPARVGASEAGGVGQPGQTAAPR